jgi:hypothetical protein
MRGRLASRSSELSESETERVAEWTIRQRSTTSHTVIFRNVVEVLGIRFLLSRGGSWHDRQRQGVYIIHIYCADRRTVTTRNNTSRRTVVRQLK